MEAGTVGRTPPLETPTLYDALEPFADARTGDINEIADGKQFSGEDIPDREIGSVLEFELAQNTECAFCSGLAVTEKRPCGALGVLLAKAELDGVVAIFRRVLFLDN